MINDKFNWEECLLFIVFFINCFVNISLGYLLYEIVFLRRLKFFLVNYYSELIIILKDLIVFLSNKFWEMNIICMEIFDNVQRVKDIMVENVNLIL